MKYYVIELVSTGKYAGLRNSSPSGWVDDIEDAAHYAESSLEDLKEYYKDRFENGEYRLHKIEK